MDYWYTCMYTVTPLRLITACVLINRVLMAICMYLYPQGLREYDIDSVILDKTLILVCTVKFAIYSLDRLSL